MNKKTAKEMDEWVNSNIDRFNMVILNDMEEKFGQNNVNIYISKIESAGCEISYVPGREIKKMMITCNKKP